MNWSLENKIYKYDNLSQKLIIHKPNNNINDEFFNIQEISTYFKDLHNPISGKITTFHIKETCEKYINFFNSNYNKTIFFTLYKTIYLNLFEYNFKNEFIKSFSSLKSLFKIEDKEYLLSFLFFNENSEFLIKYQFFFGSETFGNHLLLLKTDYNYNKWIEETNLILNNNNNLFDNEFYKFIQNYELNNNNWMFYLIIKIYFHSYFNNYEEILNEIIEYFPKNPNLIDELIILILKKNINELILNIYNKSNDLLLFTHLIDLFYLIQTNLKISISFERHLIIKKFIENLLNPKNYTIINIYLLTLPNFKINLSLINNSIIEKLNILTFNENNIKIN